MAHIQPAHMQPACRAACMLDATHLYAALAEEEQPNAAHTHAGTLQHARCGPYHQPRRALEQPHHRARHAQRARHAEAGGRVQEHAGGG